MENQRMTQQGFTTRAEAEQYAASEGIRLTAVDRESIRKSQEAERNPLKGFYPAEKVSGTRRLVENFNRLYSRFLEFLIGIGDILMTFTQTVMVSLGVPLVLILLLFVEQQRVVHGIIRESIFLIRNNTLQVGDLERFLEMPVLQHFFHRSELA
jgi:hypothetical protein